MRKEFTFHTSDGTGLYMVQDVTAPPKAAVVIVHGLCEHLGRYEYLTERLNEHNLMVYRFDHRYDNFVIVQCRHSKSKLHNFDTFVKKLLVDILMIPHRQVGLGKPCLCNRFKYCKT